jgi:uncharacterized protein Yka (UPF0111/DUF47 family)
MTLYVIHDIGPNLIKLGAKLVNTVESLTAALEDLKSAVILEAEQVAAKLADLEAMIGETVDPTEAGVLLGMVAEIKEKVAGIVPNEPPV